MQSIWMEIIQDLKSNPRDLHTVPKMKKEPLWFYASSDGEYIYIDTAREHRPASKISMTRKLSFKEMQRIYTIHLRREKGEAISLEAAAATVNQVYWYSIFKFCLSEESI